MTDVLVRRAIRMHTHTHTRRTHVKTQEEDGRQQAKENASEEIHLAHLDLRLLASRTLRQ